MEIIKHEVPIVNLTKEEYFASLAMPIMLKYALEHEISHIFETVAIDSFNIAKSMITQSERIEREKLENDNEQD